MTNMESWDLKNRLLLPKVLEAGSPRSRCQLIGFLVRALFPAYRQLPSGCVLILVVGGGVVRRKRDILVSLLQIRTLIPSGDPTLMTFSKPGVGGGGDLVTKSCLTLCNPMDYNPPVSSVHRILEARIPEWVAISFSRGPSQPTD